MAVLAKNIFKYSQQSKYSIPMGLALKLSSKSPYAADNINVISGKLISKDVYVPVKESLGVLNPLMLLGPHAVWQLLMAHSNNILNELVAELRWQGPFPDFALYHRIKPFQVKSNKPAYFASNFFNIKQNKIPTYDIMGIEAGDNTQDIVNFIEILPDMSLASLPASVSNGIIAASKPDSSIIDPASLARHGLKPLTYSSVFAPSAGGYLNWLGVKDWLPILRDWYFDCHKMLNGTVVILGQEKYIGVGENIVLDSSVFGNANFVNADKTKFVAHVESVSHSFAYEPQRGRTFVTRINFVRGVFADSSASKLANPNAFGIETDSSALPDSKKDIDNVYLE